MTTRGLSFSNGDGRMPLPFLNDAGASLRPPVYSGMVPSLLPAFSAPTAVSVVPSCFASSADTAAKEGAQIAASARARIDWGCMRVSLSERCLERERPPAAVGERAEHAVERGGGARRGVGRVVAEVAGVLQVHPVLRINVGGEPEGVIAGVVVAAQEHGRV